MPIRGLLKLITYFIQLLSSDRCLFVNCDIYCKQTEKLKKLFSLSFQKRCKTKRCLKFVMLKSKKTNWILKIGNNYSPWAMQIEWTESADCVMWTFLLIFKVAQVKYGNWSMKWIQVEEKPKNNKRTPHWDDWKTSIATFFLSHPD